LVAREIQLKRGIGRPIGIALPIVKQVLAETRPFDPLEELLWDNLIGIDVRSVHGSDDTGQLLKWLHIVE
jgi:hypothetical protein